jgi:hypothetical protein
MARALIFLSLAGNPDARLPDGLLLFRPVTDGQEFILAHQVCRRGWINSRSDEGIWEMICGSRTVEICLSSRRCVTM